MRSPSLSEPGMGLVVLENQHWKAGSMLTERDLRCQVSHDLTTASTLLWEAIKRFFPSKGENQRFSIYIQISPSSVWHVSCCQMLEGDYLLRLGGEKSDIDLLLHFNLTQEQQVEIALFSFSRRSEQCIFRAEACSMKECRKALTVLTWAQAFFAQAKPP